MTKLKRLLETMFDELPENIAKKHNQKIYPEHKIDAYIVWKKQQELTNVQKIFIEGIKRICK
ncbi:MAG: hypothetical protein J6M39_05480 [Lachnospiraceae bacterium]|nr:hypothetical protein [Lachnospiraceae bacterium]